MNPLHSPSPLLAPESARAQPWLRALPGALFAWRPDPAGGVAGQWTWLGGALVPELALAEHTCLTERLEATEAAELLAALRVAAREGRPLNCLLRARGLHGPLRLQACAQPPCEPGAPWMGQLVPALEESAAASGSAAGAGAVTGPRERSRAEARLGAALSELRTLLDLLPFAVVTSDGGGALVSCNPAARALFGWSAEGPVAVGQFVPDTLRPEALALHQRALRGEILAGRRTRRLRADGTEIEVTLTLAPLRDLRGAIVGSLTVVEDSGAAERERRSRLEHGRQLRRRLLQEVHERLKGALHETVGTLRRGLAREPALAPLLESTLAQLASMAALHGMRGAECDEGIELSELAVAVARAVERASLARVPLLLQRTGAESPRLCQEEALAVALILNELALEAVHQPAQTTAARGARVTVSEFDTGAEVRLIGRGCRAETLQRVRALLPEAGAALRIERQGPLVEITLTLAPPVLERADAVVEPARNAGD